MAKRRKYRRTKRRRSNSTIARWFRKIKRKVIQVSVLALFTILFVGIIIFARSTPFSPRFVPQEPAQYDGIDVSKHQGSINWAKVSNNPNIKFVYIKATEGSSLVDSKYKNNFREAKSNGMLVGSYHYFIGRKSAKEQFANFKNVVNKSQQDLLPVVDVEESGNRTISRTELQRNLEEFMLLVKKEYGKYPILYSQYSFYNRKLAPEFNKYYIFIARYSKKEPVLKGGGKYNIWQYSEKGKVEGIQGNVDLDRFANNTHLSDITY